MKHKLILNIIFTALLISCNGNAQKKIKLKPTKYIDISIPEPSDICYSFTTDTFFVVSDQGILFETDRNGKVLRKLDQKDTDFEGVYVNNKTVYAVDESGRTIYEYDLTTLKNTSSTTIPYNGARNKGYESFEFDKNKNEFLLITEKDPILLFELSTDLKVIKQTDLSSIAKDISSARFYNNSLWLLSDEDAMLLKVDPITYEVIKKWKLPVINPEGLAFDKDGTIMITCDDMQRLYYFNNPEKIN